MNDYNAALMTENKIIELIQDLEDKVNLIALHVDKIEKQVARMIEYK